MKTRNSSISAANIGEILSSGYTKPQFSFPNFKISTRYLGERCWHPSLPTIEGREEPRAFLPSIPPQESNLLNNKTIKKFDLPPVASDCEELYALHLASLITQSSGHHATGYSFGEC